MNNNNQIENGKKLAEDFLTLHRECSYTNKTDDERERMEHLAGLARIVMGFSGDWNPDDDDPGFGGC